MWKRLCVVGIAAVSLSCASSEAWTKRGATPGEVTITHVAAPARATGLGTGIEFDPPPGFCSAGRVELSRFAISKTDLERSEAFVEPDVWDAVDDEARVALAVWVSNCLFDGKSVTLRHGRTGRYIGLYSWKSGFIPISVGARTAPPGVEP